MAGSAGARAHDDQGFRDDGARGRPKGADTLDEFATWVETLLRQRGYDIDSPRGGGRSRLADDAGVHRAAVSRLLQRQSMPDLETMRRLALVLGIPLRDMLIRSGRLTAEDLPLGGPVSGAHQGNSPADEKLLSPEEAARRMGVPPELRETFVKVARQFLPSAGD
ncbi:helix-turn-helix transcriptional regulator [Streptomyces sp. NPDC046939]|uniref:helix-turn-helix transcriptional regulator n=1 Tax=Streptomyces sp. NPDC046939 TaxID=3155376 RepID=UPI0033F1163E